MKDKVCAIILAAGSGSRMQLPITKQRLTVLGESLLHRCVRAFDESEVIDYITVVTRADELDYAKNELSDIGKLVSIKEGGKTRADSARAGFSAVPEDTAYIAIHDGARCYLADNVIEKVVADAKKYGAATASHIVTDTVKRVDGDFITATEDRVERTVMEVLPAEYRHLDLKPVGRLDKATEGLLLFTNDGDFSNAIIHPSTHVPKYYRVTLRKPMTEEQRLQFEEGVMLDGRRTAPCEVRIVSSAPDRCVVEIVLYEGRNRQIRRMCETFGLEVIRLRRNAIDKVKLGMLPVGNWRYLSPDEVRNLVMATGVTKKIAAGYINYGREPDRDYHTARR